MGRPKQKDYEASEAEKASASVGKANYDFFKANYDPLLREMRDQTRSEDTRLALRGRAGADTMQALTSAPTYRRTQTIGATGDLSQALTGQLGVADKAAKNIQNTASTNVLGIARGQQADASTGMAKASRLATSDALARARNKLQVKNAAIGAGLKVAGTVGGEMAEQGKLGDFGKEFFRALPSQVG
tara:strand:+ start:1423 stop:1983 length:561 start_codon:yes stop_codon:yes gene_type:complete